MNVLDLLATVDNIGFHIIRVIISVFWQSSLLIGAIALTTFVLRRRSAKLRYLLWASLLCTLPFIPLLTWIASIIGTPQVEIPIIPNYSTPISTMINRSVDEPQLILPPIEKKESTSAPVFRLKDYPWAIAFLGYAIGVLFFLSLISVGRLRIHRWIHRGTVVTDRRILSAFQKAREQLGLARKSVVIEYSDIPTPLTVGTFHPVILIPEGCIEHLSNTELQSLAIHELAHIKRNDALVLTLVSLVRALVFFQPLVWVAARQVAKKCSECL